MCAMEEEGEKEKREKRRWLICMVEIEVLRPSIEVIFFPRLCKRVSETTSERGYSVPVWPAWIHLAWYEKRKYGHTTYSMICRSDQLGQFWPHESSRKGQIWSHCRIFNYTASVTSSYNFGRTHNSNGKGQTWPRAVDCSFSLFLARFERATRARAPGEKKNM